LNEFPEKIQVCKNKRLKENTIAKDFKTTDVYGIPLSLESFRGQKVLLSFMRYTGCPVCNLHVYELLMRKADIDKKNLAIVLVFESSIKSVKKYIKNESLPFAFISDREQSLYNAYAVEKSWSKCNKWRLTFKGLTNAIKALPNTINFLQ